jgi:hypothetical protein
MPYAWLWMVITAIGVIVWAFGAGLLDRTGPNCIGQPQIPPSSQNPPYSPSTDFAALIDAIHHEGVANRKEEKQEDNGKVFRDYLTIIILGITLYALWNTYLAISDQVGEMHKVYPEVQRQAAAAKTQAETANTTMIATQRAWLGAIDAAIIKAANSSVIKGAITYVNSGHEPARFQSKGLDERVYIRQDWDAGFVNNVIAARQEDCMKTDRIDGFQSAWPTTGLSTYTIHFPEAKMPQIGTAAWSDRINNGDDIVTVQGCFVYETFSKIRHTSFCFYYDARATDASHLNFCGVGNYAN